MLEVRDLCNILVHGGGGRAMLVLESESQILGLSFWATLISLGKIGLGEEKPTCLNPLPVLPYSDSANILQKDFQDELQTAKVSVWWLKELCK